jgi:antitoxin FitA
MPMIQIRHVDEAVHRELKARAAQAGMSLSDYLRREIERLAASPAVDVVLGRIAARPRVDPSESPEAATRAEREAR